MKKLLLKARAAHRGCAAGADVWNCVIDSVASANECEHRDDKHLKDAVVLLEARVTS